MGACAPRTVTTQTKENENEPNSRKKLKGNPHVVPWCPVHFISRRDKCGGGDAHMYLDGRRP